MHILLNIFLLFVKISMFSFGGGYVAFPIIQEANKTFQWMTDIELSNILSVAGMSPGPVAINAAVGVGYKAAGGAGVLAAFLGIALPCAVIVIVVAGYFFKVYKRPLVRNVLYVLRAVITGVIIYAGVSFALVNGMIFAHVFENSGTAIHNGLNISIGTTNIFEAKSLGLILVALILLIKTRIHPILIIISGGILGIILF